MTIRKAKAALPTILNFEKKLIPSDAVFHSGNWGEADDQFMPVQITNQSGRGWVQAKSKFDERVINMTSIYQSDSAALHYDHDTLRVSASLRVIGGVGVPHSCNNTEFLNSLSAAIDQYRNEIGLEELAHRYATNIASGRWLWRNRVGAEKIKITIESPSTNELLEFDGYDYSVRNFDKKTPELEALTKIIKGALEGSTCAQLKIRGYLKLVNGSVVYPSEELLTQGKTGKNKILYSCHDAAAMHSQKIGNALRTIDDWHKELSGEDRVISVEAFGTVTPRLIALRSPKSKQDFYSLFEGWVFNKSELTIDQKHYVIAMLIRGGLLGDY